MSSALSNRIWRRSATTLHSRLRRPDRFGSRDHRLLFPASSSNRTESFSAWSSLWNLMERPKKGTGFDNFIPKDEAEKAADAGGGASTGGGGDKKNSNNNNGIPPNSNNWLLLAAALGIAVMLMNSSNDLERSSSSSTNSSSEQQPLVPHSEISWQDFLHLLKQKDVHRIVVNENDRSNTATARVYVKKNSTGFGYTTTTNDSHHHQPTNPATWLEQQQQAQQELFFGNRVPSSSTTASTTPLNSNNSHFFYRLPIGSLDAFERKLEDAQRALGQDTPDQEIPVQYTSPSTLTREVVGILPGLAVAAFVYAMLRMSVPRAGGGGGGGGGIGGIFQFGKSTAKKIKKEDISVTFQDVAGCEEAKKEIMEFVDFLKDSSRFTKLGAKIPKGALLCGPPGTGKTLLAKAVAGEAGVPFYSISGSDFIEMFVGVGPSRVRDLFSEARSNAPCIIFIDEIDAVGRKRAQGMGGGNDERENTLNQLLVEMDGFSSTTGVVVLAGTNRVDVLDQALTRPGRFDRQVTVDKPDLQGRKAIFNVHLKGITLEKSVEDVAGRLAGLTPGFTGADIANVCNEAAIVAARRKGKSVTQEDFEKATDRIIGGLESNKIMSKEEQSIVAYHEAGHAVAGWFLEHADPLLKVTIIPRSSGALGFAQYLPKEVFLRTNDQIMDIVCMALAGRAAEEIFFGRVTTGASDDLKRVTQLVYSTIQLYGMNRRLGQLAFPKDPNAFFDDRPYSEKTAKAMDEEAKAIVDEAYQRTLTLLREKKNEVENVAKLLLKKETITHDDVYDLVGARPFEGDPMYKEYISNRQRSPLSGEKDKTQKGETNEADLDGLAPGLA